MVPSIFGQFFFERDLIILGNFSKASSRDYDHLNSICFAQRDPTCNMAQLFEGNKWNTLGVQVWYVLSIFMLIYLEIRSNYFVRFIRIQTLILA